MRVVACCFVACRLARLSVGPLEARNELPGGTERLLPVEEAVACFTYSSCFPPVRVFAVLFGVVAIVMLLGQRYARHAPSSVEQRRRFRVIASAALFLSVASLAFLFARVCEAGSACVQEVGVPCAASSPVYVILSVLLPLVSLGITLGELLRRVVTR